MSVGNNKRPTATEPSPVANQYRDTTYKIIGAAMRVHNELGPGLKESIYQAALSVAMRDAGLSFEEERPIEIAFGDEEVGLLYLDHFVEEAIIVEEKALSHLMTDDEVGQVITYLTATKSPLGLLINFGRRSLEYRRILPPRKLGDWQGRVARYVWRPQEAAHGTDAPSAPKLNPLIRSKSADRSAP